MMKHAPTSQTQNQSPPSSSPSPHDQTQFHDSLPPLPRDPDSNCMQPATSLHNGDKPHDSSTIVSAAVSDSKNSVGNVNTPDVAQSSGQDAQLNSKPSPFQSIDPDASIPKWIEGEPRDRDVLLGRGGRSNAHPGNITFRTLVVENRQKYKASQSNKEKHAIGKQIVDTICSVPEGSSAGTLPGRFIAYDAGVQKWYDVGEIQARNKTTQALREEKAGAPSSKLYVDSMGVRNNHKSTLNHKTSAIQSNKSAENPAPPAVEASQRPPPNCDIASDYPCHPAPPPVRGHSTSSNSAGSNSPPKLKKEARTVTLYNESNGSRCVQVAGVVTSSDAGLKGRMAQAPNKPRSVATDERLITEDCGGVYPPQYPLGGRMGPIDFSYRPSVYTAGGRVAAGPVLPLLPPPASISFSQHPGAIGPPRYMHTTSQHHSFQYPGLSSKFAPPIQNNESLHSMIPAVTSDGRLPISSVKDRGVAIEPQVATQNFSKPQLVTSEPEPCLGRTHAPAILKINLRSKLRRSYSDTFVDDFNSLKKESFLKSWKELKEMSTSPNFSVVPPKPKTAVRKQRDMYHYSGLAPRRSPVGNVLPSQFIEPIVPAKNIISTGADVDRGRITKLLEAEMIISHSGNARFSPAGGSESMRGSGLTSNGFGSSDNNGTRLPQSILPDSARAPFSAEEFQEAVERLHYGGPAELEHAEKLSAAAHQHLREREEEIAAAAAAAGVSPPSPNGEANYARPDQYLRYDGNDGHKPDGVRRSVTEVTSPRRSPTNTQSTGSGGNRSPMPSEGHGTTDDADSTETERILASVSDMKEDEAVTGSPVLSDKQHEMKSERKSQDASGTFSRSAGAVNNQKKQPRSRKRAAPDNTDRTTTALKSSAPSSKFSGDRAQEKYSKKAKKDKNSSAAQKSTKAVTQDMDIDESITFSKQYAPFNENAPLATNIKEPREQDVLFGRGGRTNHHPGNKRFRQLVEEHRQGYRQLHGNKRKQKIATHIVDQIYSIGGRFLRMSGGTSGLWEDVGKKTARGKTSQALREAHTTLTPLVKERDGKVKTDIGESAKKQDGTDHNEIDVASESGCRNSGNTPPPLSLVPADRHISDDHKDVGLLLLGLKASHSPKMSNAAV